LSRHRSRFAGVTTHQEPTPGREITILSSRFNPDDINRVSHAIDYFSRQNDKAREQAMRAHALKNVVKSLTEEEKRFTSFTKGSLKELGLARGPSYDAKAGEDRILARAEKRGDILAVEEGRSFLGLAINYYERAQQPAGIQKVREGLAPGEAS